MWATLGYLGVLLLQLVVIGRVLLLPRRASTSRVAWIVVVALLPGLGILLYLAIGETSIGRERAARARAAVADLAPPVPASAQDAEHLRPRFPERYAPLFRLGETINGFPPIGGNRAFLTVDSNDAIEKMVADIDAATDHVHLTFYIWLDDNNGLKVAEALKRAAGRGVTCRAMADAIGSRHFIRSKHWKDLAAAGVHVASGLPVRNIVLRPSRGRVDLRNHRKIVVIDDRITYCGSQNCADPEFRVKAKFAPWVDALMRFEGPIARQNQQVFVDDWMTCVDEDLRPMLEQPIRAPHPGFTAQVIATGPTVRHGAMPETFVSLMYAAERELVITTPYFVPDAPMQAALCAAARRGVDTTIVFPARNDSAEVGPASRSFYLELLEAGVQIHEFVGGLLHTKSLALDGEVTLIGSANMDRRSLDLNYENNILFHDPELTAAMRARQDAYLASSRPVTLDEVRAWPMHRRLWNSFVGMFGPLI